MWDNLYFYNSNTTCLGAIQPRWIVELIGFMVQGSGSRFSISGIHWFRVQDLGLGVQ